MSGPHDAARLGRLLLLVLAVLTLGLHAAGPAAVAKTGPGRAIAPPTVAPDSAAAAASVRRHFRAALAEQRTALRLRNGDSV
ncbi:MAG: hypothetical protein M3389_02870, partial [Actinomycetota bacterium]|nr:hypothetical protein [Actinomycetota bacterium]